jgi:hypothetical protein
MLLCGAIYIVPFFSVFMCDRYIAPCVPFIAVAVVAFSDVSHKLIHPKFKKLSVMASFLIALIGLFSIGATHDYLAWNRARWAALRYLTSTIGVSPRDVDGGYEFNGFYLYDRNTDTADRADSRTRSWWWVSDDKYQIAFGPVIGYAVVKEYSYHRWLPPDKQKVLILRRSQPEGIWP